MNSRTLKTVLVVCNGNVGRSVIAEYCLNLLFRKAGLLVEKGMVATSRGVNIDKRSMRNYPAAWSIVEPLLLGLGISLRANQASKEIDATVVDDAVLILAMDREIYRFLRCRFPKSAYKTRLFSELEGKFDDIPDTKGVTDPALQNEMILQIFNTVRNNLQQVIALAEYFADYDRMIAQDLS